MAEEIRRCYPCVTCPGAPEPPKWRGCESSSLCPYTEEHHVHHGIGTMVLDPHPFRCESERVA